MSDQPTTPTDEVRPTAPTEVPTSESSAADDTTRGWLGVDLGTTWTAAALDGEVLTLSDRHAAMPSVVALDGDHFVTGDAGERRLAVEPASGAREMKRRLGDTTPYVLAGTPYGPEALMARLLADVVAIATERNGAAPSEVVLTHPANWGEYKLDLLRECARLAGVERPRLVSEPAAAALQYVALGRVKPGDVVAVYDFGGGTFDAAVIRCGAQGAELLGTAEGLERLGGIDIDQVVVAHVNEALDGQLGELDTSSDDVRRGLARLRADCTAAKEALSTDSEASISLAVPGLSTTVRVTRPELEEAVRPRIDDTLAALDRAVRSAGVTNADLAGIVMVGGSSRIPLVREMVAAHTGRPILVDADAKAVVSLGATQRLTSPADVPAVSDADADVAAGGAAAKPGSRLVASAEHAAESRRSAVRPAVLAGAGVAVAGVAAAAYAVNEFVLGDDDDDSLDALDGLIETAVRGPAETDGSPGAAEAANMVRADHDADGASLRLPTQSDRGELSPSEASVLAALLGSPDGRSDGGVAAAGRLGGPLGAQGPLGPTGPFGAPGTPGSSHIGGAPGPAAHGGMPSPMGMPGPPAHHGGGADNSPSGQRPHHGGGQRGGHHGEGGQHDDDGPMRPPSGRPPAGRPADGAMPPRHVDADFEDAKATLLQRLERWEPPAGADPKEVAELRERLHGLIERHQVLPGQSADEAIDALRDEFTLRVHDFTQDVKLDSLIDEDDKDAAAEKALREEVDSARDRLRDRLDSWTPPEGASDEDVAELKKDLAGVLDRYRPLPGQSADDAIAELRQRFSDRVKDFSQDTKIDVLIDDSVDTPPSADPAAPTDPATTDPAPTDPATPSDPAASDPAASDPAATDPAATDPAATDPAAPDAASTSVADPAHPQPVVLIDEFDELDTGPGANAHVDDISSSIGDAAVTAAPSVDHPVRDEPMAHDTGVPDSVDDDILGADSWQQSVPSSSGIGEPAFHDVEQVAAHGVDEALTMPSDAPDDESDRPLDFDDSSHDADFVDTPSFGTAHDDDRDPEPDDGQDDF